MHNKAAVPIILTILLLVALCCLGVCLVLFASGTILATSLNIFNDGTITVEVPAERWPLNPPPASS